MQLRIRHIIVDPRESVLVYRDGCLVTTLGAGRHPRPRRAVLRPVDLRVQLTPVASQEVPSVEGATVRASLVIRWSVRDAAAFVETAESAIDQVYLAAQLALRSAVGARGVDDLTGPSARAEIQADLTRPAQAAAAAYGIEVHEVVLKDLILPAEVREAAVAVLTARQRGLAQLETARAETAAMRSRANAARILQDSPALARQRLVESLPYGTQVVLRLEDLGG
ncbi:MAG: slipin family protein [Micrococcales bacterium]|nr:slipin family protein [Micrococcales bacterium]